MSKDIGFCSITEDICKKDGKCEDCSLKHIHENIEHYAKLHEENRLIELPCAVGDMVWMVIDNRDFKRRMKDYCPSAEELPDLNIVEHNFSLLLLSSIGKTVFLTKEEAEAKLKELGE